MPPLLLFAVLHLRRVQVSLGILCAPGLHLQRGPQRLLLIVLCL
jgi:hypothetical protein